MLAGSVLSLMEKSLLQIKVPRSITLTWLNMSKSKWPKSKMGVPMLDLVESLAYQYSLLWVLHVFHRF
jgi:hypothetical protein